MAVLRDLRRAWKMSHCAHFSNIICADLVAMYRIEVMFTECYSAFSVLSIVASCTNSKVVDYAGQTYLDDVEHEPLVRLRTYS